MTGAVVPTSVSSTRTGESIGEEGFEVDVSPLRLRERVSPFRSVEDWSDEDERRREEEKKEPKREVGRG